MERIHLSAPSLRRDGDRTTVSCTVTIPGRPAQELWIRTTAGAVADRADSFVVMSLLPAMRLGVPLVSEAPVSRSLHESGLPAAQNVLGIWRHDPHLPGNHVFRQVPVNANALEDLPGGEAVGLFFSGGLDSNFSLVEAGDEVTHLVFIDHFEFTYPSHAAQQAHAGVTNVADAWGKRVILADTNARSVFDGLVSWAFFHGSLLAGVGLQLQGLLRAVHIASSSNVRMLHPWGSHPYLDPLWATTATALVHDRIDVTRLQKTEVVAEHPELLQNLRVCWKPEHNCGTCSKCVRTLLALQVLDRYRPGYPFERPPITAPELARMDLRERYSVYQGIEDFLSDTGRHPDLLAALRTAHAGWYHTPVGGLFRGDLPQRLRRGAGGWPIGC